MDRDPAWYVVYTRPHAEEVAARNLVRQGFDTFLPRLSKRRRHARKLEIVQRPLFPRYLFVAVDLAVDRWRAIHSTIGVAGLVCHGEAPSEVPRDVVATLLEQCDSNGVLLAEDRQTFTRGDLVRILDGAFSNLTAVFERMTDSERVAVLLNLMGRTVRVMLHADALEPAT